MAKEQGTKLIAQNKKARHDYAIEDKYEAGLVRDVAREREYPRISQRHVE